MEIYKYELLFKNQHIIILIMSIKCYILERISSNEMKYITNDGE